MLCPHGISGAHHSALGGNLGDVAGEAKAAVEGVLGDSQGVQAGNLGALLHVLLQSRLVPILNGIDKCQMTGPARTGVDTVRVTVIFQHLRILGGILRAVIDEILFLLGPIITATGRRPVQVTGFENPRRERGLEEMGIVIGPGIEMVKLDNGAMVKSIHGHYTREGANRWNFQIYCQNGMMESARFPEQKDFLMYTEGKEVCKGKWEKYDPAIEYGREYFLKIADRNSHGGADFYAPYFFLEKIQGRPDGDWIIDVYQAVDMGICGILAWRSAVNGNIPVAVPNLRDPAQRDAYRNDHACTTPAVAGDQLMPITTFPHEPVTAEKFEEVRQMYLKKNPQ